MKYKFKNLGQVGTNNYAQADVTGCLCPAPD